MKWTKERIKELEDLRAMIITLKGLDRGSNFLGNLQDCMKIAEKFMEFDLSKSHENFIDFLYSICIEEQMKEKEAKK